MRIARIVMAAGISMSSLFLFSGCGKEKDHGNISIKMTDAPGPYQQVNVQILQVSVNLENSPTSNGWHILPTNSGTYDLLRLQNGIDTTIVNLSSLPPGDITQMRLLLGANNSVMVDSVLYPMKVPSGSQTGIKLVGNIEVVPNSTVQVLIDFNANESVVQHGNGEYHLKPVVKVL